MKNFFLLAGIVWAAGAASAKAQDPVPPPLVGFEKFSVKGAIDHPDSVEGDGSVRLDAQFTLSSKSDGLLPLDEDVFLELEPHPPLTGYPPSPCNIVAVPAGCLVAKGAGFELQDPKGCGFRWFLLFEDGKTMDLTPHVSRARLRLEESLGTWVLRLRLEVTEEAAIPPVPCNIVASVGNDFGQSLVSSKVSFQSLP